MSEEEDLESLARRLAAADFSPDSRIRTSLRASLLGKPRMDAVSLSLPARAIVFAAAAAAVAAFALFSPRSRTAVPASPAPPAAAVSAPTPPRTRRSPVSAFPKDEFGLPILPGRFAARGPAGEPAPLSSRAIAGLFTTRRVTLDDLFVKRAL